MKFDANRNKSKATFDVPEVVCAFLKYKSDIDDAKSVITRSNHAGLFIDIHGHGHRFQLFTYLFKRASVWALLSAILVYLYICLVQSRLNVFWGPWDRRANGAPPSPFPFLPSPPLSLSLPSCPLSSPPLRSRPLKSS